MTSAHFRDRYAIQSLDDGGVVVDLVTGNYARLNRAAASICQALIKSEGLTSARILIATQLGLSDTEAASAVEAVIAALGAPSPRRVRSDAIVYALAQDSDGYVFSSNGSPKIWMSADGLILRLESGIRPSAWETSEYLRAMAPRLLFLQGGAVLHGAACRKANRAFAVCGDSGAGKTTTARAFDAAGARLFAEDMLVISTASPLTVHEGGEETIRKWAQTSADELIRTSSIETSGLRAVFGGPPISVAEIWFISANQRVDDGRILSRRLGATDGALAVIASLFLGATTAPEWRRFLDLAGTIAASTPAFEARMPDGLERLRRTAASYALNSA